MWDAKRTCLVLMVVLPWVALATAMDLPFWLMLAVGLAIGGLIGLLFQVQDRRSRTGRS